MRVSLCFELSLDFAELLYIMSLVTASVSLHSILQVVVLCLPRGLLCGSSSRVSLLYSCADVCLYIHDCTVRVSIAILWCGAFMLPFWQPF